MNYYQTRFSDKLKEALKAVAPIIGIVLLLSFTIAPIPPSILLLFLFGAVLLIVGMMFFTLGAELSMTPMGEKVGTKMAKTMHLGTILFLCFLLGFVITISEPDLQVLAEQVPSIPNYTLILAVACGVGFFLVVAMLRMLFSKSLSTLLIFFYILVAVLTLFVPKDFVAVAFDSGGVTTGPMTVPFIMALGIGFAAVRSDKHAEDDSFGLVSLCSIGPILAVLLLGLLYHPEDAGYVPAPLPDIQDSIELWQHFAGNFPAYIKEIAVSLFPIVAFFGAFQIVSLKLKKKTLYKILIGIADTYIGLVLFLTGANVGFMPAGNHLGQMIADLPFRFILIPIGMVIGFFIVKAEPAVYVLMDQVEEITSGAIPGRAMGLSMSLGVAASVGIAMIRVLTGVSILWFIVPGYIIAICLSFFVPKIFTAIAFDSGGVASGPMTAAFLLPFAMGACQAVGGNIVRDAFGIVAMVAMTPLIAIQILGAVYQYKSRTAEAMEAAGAAYLDTWGDDDIIEL
ncbi:DUF1538 domain-containing protein [Schaedlerella sp.]|uniref:DUF1538 domain-containing protein n=1 Tax=Schaedlerella sp. TaxID=2676057 RepID=UPI0026267802|nr:DUF1538 domain-containing protein [uncultured Schaedlerella sp.]